jgi:hypothetical protein
MKRGTVMLWKHNKQLAFEKIDDEEVGWWVSLDSTYNVEVYKDKEKSYVVRPESEKPLYNEKSALNRYAFKWSDKQVFDYWLKNIAYE